MSHYRPYPAYKDSGVDWLGMVPENWRVKRLRYAARLNPSIKAELLVDSNAEVSFIPMESIGEDGSLNLEQTRTVADVRNGYSYFENDDVAFAKVTPCFENGKGTLFRNLLGGVGFGTTELTVLRPKDGIDACFLNYLVQCNRFRAFGKGAMTGAGGLKRVPDEFTRNFEAVWPLIEEQRSISYHLDCETARIDELVSKKTRFIELLREKRQALITHAVTKGLDPNVQMKDSGVEWLGDVPEHWGVSPVKFLILPKAGAIKTGPFGSQLTSVEMQAGTIKVYNQRNVIDGDLVSGDNYITEGKYLELSSFRVFPGDILITTRGTIGKVTIVPDEAEIGILHPCLIRIQIDESKISKEFFACLLGDSHLLQSQISYLSNASTIEVIYSETMGSILVPVPPINEQIEILALIKNKTTRIDTLITKTERSIELLKERRSALITAAVTGQIDLREAV